MKVTKEVNWRRPNSVYAFKAKPGPEPQEFPADFVDHAVSIGAADKVPSPTKDEKKALERATKAG
jgi:hypothetical protein